VGLAADLGGNAYIVDSGNGRIRRVDAQGVIDTISGSTMLLNPLWIATDGSGNVFYSEPLLNRVRRIAPDGSVETVAGAGDTKLNNPQGVAVDREGNLYIADSGNSAVLKVAADGIITTLAAGLPSPQGVAVDAEGNVFVTSRHKVYRISPAGELTRIAGGDVPGFAGDEGPAVHARLNQAGAICVDSLGAIYIADAGNHRIRKLSVE
jgi:DNA-binding beta-propeller fold protein YncE